MKPLASEMHPLFPSQIVAAQKFSFLSVIHTLMSKVLFVLMFPFAFLGAYDLIRGFYFAEADQITTGDAALSVYILLGLLLWLALLAVTDLPGGGRIVTRIVWALHVLFNLLAIPFWMYWQPLPNQALGFQGLGFLANVAIYPVLAVSSTCFLLSIINNKHTP